MQLALAVRTMKAMTENTVALKAAAAQTIAHLNTIAAGAAEELARAQRTIETLTENTDALKVIAAGAVGDLNHAVAELHSVTEQLRHARGDRRMSDEEADITMHVIGYGPEGTIGMTFASNAEATAATGGCSHERIKGCRNELEAEAFVQAVQDEIEAGVTGWARGFHAENVFAVAHGRRSSCLVFSDRDKRLLVDGVSGGLSRQFRERESARRWLLQQRISPYWRRPGMSREDTIYAGESDDEMPEVMEFVEHPDLTGRHRAVALGRTDMVQEAMDAELDDGSEPSFGDSDATP